MLKLGNGSTPAFPGEQASCGRSEGLTKLEFATIMILQGKAANAAMTGMENEDEMCKSAARMAVKALQAANP